MLFTVPRYLQKFAAQVLVGDQQHPRLKRVAYELAHAFARGPRAAALGGRGDGLRRRSSIGAVARGRVPADPQQARLRPAGAGGLRRRAAAGRDDGAVADAAASTCVEMYGQTETAGGIIAGQRGPFPRPGDVGTVPEGCEVRLGDDGEMLVRKPDLFEGYWNNAEATAAVLADDGWLRTGDVGEWRERQAALVDRARDFLVTAGGKTISPVVRSRMRCARALTWPRPWCSARGASI